MSAITFLETITFEVVGCCNARCGMRVGLPADYLRRLRSGAGDFWCPACGTKQGWHKSEADKLREELVNAKAAKDREAEGRRRAEQDADYFKSSRNAYKGQVTRLKNRAANGVCPCCNRYFENLHRHMQNKHPDFKNDEGLPSNTSKETSEQ